MRKKESLQPGDLLAEYQAEDSHSKRLGRYSSCKHRALIVAEILAKEPSYVKYYRKLKSCGDWLLYRNFYRLDLRRLIGGIHCDQHLLCPLCAIRRAARFMRSYSEKLNFVLSENKNLRPYLITLTVKNGFDLTERFLHLQKSLRKMISRRRKRLSTGRGTKTVLMYVKGAVWTYEVTYSEKGWHPHVHMIALSEEPISVQELRSEWFDLTGDSWVVDSRPIESYSQDDLIPALLEVFKYAVKLSGLPPEKQIEVWSNLKGRRLLGSFGCLWGVKVPSFKVDEIEEQLKDEPYVDEVYRYFSSGYQLSSCVKLPRDLSGIYCASLRKPGSPWGAEGGSGQSSSSFFSLVANAAADLEKKSLTAEGEP